VSVPPLPVVHADEPLGEVPPRPRPARDFLAQPPGWPFHAVCALVALGMLAAASSPAPDLFWGVPLLALLFLVWLGRLLAHLCVRGRRRRWFLVAPAGFAVLVTLLAYQVPLHARFALSESAFAAAADRAEQGVPNWYATGRLGLYDVERIGRLPGRGVVFTTGQYCGLFGTAGLARLPDGEPGAGLHEYPGMTFEHLRGPWYTWCAEV
jgi:hypothetical protein